MKRLLPTILFAIILFFGILLIAKGPANKKGMENLLKNGKHAKAKITRVKAYSNNNSIGYSLDLSWRDDKGKMQSHSGLDVMTKYPTKISKLHSALSQFKGLTDRIYGEANPATSERLKTLTTQIKSLSAIDIKYSDDGSIILANEEKLYQYELVNNNDFVYGLIAVAFAIIGLLLLFFVTPLAAQIFFLTGSLAVVAYYHLFIESLT